MVSRLVRVLLLAGALAAPAAVHGQGRYVPQGAAQRHFGEAQRLIEEGDALRDRGDAEGAREKYEAAAEALREAVEADPDYGDAYVKLGLVYYALGQSDEVVPLLEQGLQRDKNNLELMFWLGNHLLRVPSGRTDEAVGYLEKVAASSDAFPEVYLVLGTYYYKEARDYTRARIALEQYVRHRPDDLAARGMLGNTYFKLEQYREALAEFEAVQRRSPRNIGVQVNIGNAHFRLGNYEKAVELLLDALKRDPDRRSVLFNLAQSYYQLGRYEDALTYYRRYLEGAPRSFNGHYFAGSALLNLGRHDEAEAELLEATRLEPDIAQPWYKLGLIELHRGRPARAEERFRAALERKEGDPWATSAVGTALRAQGRLDEAIDWHERAVRLAPEEPRLHGNVALTALKAGRVEDAAKAARRALAGDPDDPWLKRLGAAVYAAAAERHLSGAAGGDEGPRTAADLLRKALVFAPDDPALKADLALALLALGQTDEAVRMAEEAHAAAPDRADLRFALGRASLAAGRFADARAHFAAAYAQRPRADLAAAEGAAALLAGDVEGAVERLEAALKAHPEGPGAEAVRLNRGLARFARLVAALGGDGPPRATDLRAALEIEGEVPPALAARIRYAALVLALRAGDAGDARAHARQMTNHLAAARQTDPDARAFSDRAPARHLEFLTAYAYALAGRYDAARGVLEDIRASRKRGAPESRLLIHVYARLAERRFEAGALDDAARWWKAADALDADPAIDHNLAVVDWLQNRRRRAKRRWRQLAGRVAEAWFNLGVVHETAGRHSDAFDHFVRYVRADGRHAARAREIVEAKKRIFGFR